MDGRKLGPPTVNGQPNTLRGFPGLKFKFLIERVQRTETNFELLISAAGPRDDRERWLRAFQCWCDFHDLSPEIIHGNSRTHRTATRTLVACWPSIPAFLFRLIGEDWARYSHQDGNAASAVEEWQITALRQQISKLEKGIRQVDSRVWKDTTIGFRRPRRAYSTRLTAFARSGDGAR